MFRRNVGLLEDLAMLQSMRKKLTKLLADIEMKNQELFDWCRGWLAEQRTVKWQ